MTEKNSLPLFLEDVYDALKAIVAALGGTKEVAGRLWPHKPIEQARKELLDALNRDNPRKLDAEETLALLRMAREAGFHQAKHWIDAELGYEPSMPIVPSVQRDRLADELARAAEHFANLTKAVERISPSVPASLLKKAG
jgi:hypothetical protein